MAKMYNPRKSLGAIEKSALRLLRVVGSSTLTAGFLCNFAIAQTKAFSSTSDNAFAGATIQKVGLPLLPLSPQQMSAETAQGLPSVNPGLSPQSRGNNAVVLWDEVTPGKAASSNPPVSGTVTLNIVH